MALFQYQGTAEPLLPMAPAALPTGPDAWGYPPQVPLRRALAAAVGIFLVAPVLVPVAQDASQFQYPAQSAVRGLWRAQPDSSVDPVHVPVAAPPFEYPPNYEPQIPVRRGWREQPNSTVLPLLAIPSSGYPGDITVALVPVGGCGGVSDPPPDSDEYGICYRVTFGLMTRTTTTEFGAVERLTTPEFGVITRRTTPEFGEMRHA